MKTSLRYQKGSVPSPFPTHRIRLDISVFCIFGVLLGQQQHGVSVVEYNSSVAISESHSSTFETLVNEFWVGLYCQPQSGVCRLCTHEVGAVKMTNLRR